MEKTCKISLEDGTKIDVIVTYEYIQSTMYALDYILDDVDTEEYEVISITNEQYQDFIDAEYEDVLIEVKEQM